MKRKGNISLWQGRLGWPQKGCRVLVGCLCTGMCGSGFRESGSHVVCVSAMQSPWTGKGVQLCCFLLALCLLVLTSVLGPDSILLRCWGVKMND